MSTLMKQNNSLTIPIYLDYSSTTPVDPRVAAKMSECLTKEGVFGNPASRSHSFGWESEKLIDEARGHVAKLIKANKKEIVWTSGATESDNLAIKGAAHFYKEKGNHLITLTTEHKAVLDTMRHLETEGFEVTYMNPKDNGLVDIDELKSLIKPTTTVISIMHVNNEIGVIQDLETIGKICRDKNIPCIMFCDESRESINMFREKYDLKLPIFINDGTELKTISRSNPSVLFIENAVVKAKYSARSIPTREEFLTKYFK